MCATAMAVKTVPNAPHTRAHLTQTLRSGHVHDHGRRKAVECERDVSASVAVETARDVPERSSQHDAEEQVRGRGQRTARVLPATTTRDRTKSGAAATR